MEGPDKLRRGFSLIETIFSSLVIALVVLTVFNLFPSAMVAVKRSETQVQADLLAQSLIDQMKIRPINQLRDLITLGAQTNTVRIDGTDFTHTVEVSNLSTPPEELLLSVHVTVDWRLRNKDYTVERESWVHAIPR